MYVRPDQIRVLEIAQRQRLIERLAGHVAATFEPIVAQIGPARARTAIENALERASLYGIETDGDLCEFVNVVFVLGDTFPFAPEFAWARRILELRGPSAEWKLQRVRQRATDILTDRALAELDAT